MRPWRRRVACSPSGAPKKAPKPEKIQITIQNDVAAPAAASTKPRAPKATATTAVTKVVKPAATTVVRAAPKPKAIKASAGGIVQPDPKNFERQKELIKKAKGAEVAAAVVTKKVRCRCVLARSRSRYCVEVSALRRCVALNRR